MKNLLKQRLLPFLSLLLLTLLLLLVGGHLLASAPISNVIIPESNTIEINHFEQEVICMVETIAIPTIEIISENIQ